MGSGMARQLLASNSPLTCYDPKKRSLENMGQLGAEMANSASMVAAKSHTIILSLPKADIVEQVMMEIHSSI